MKTLYGFFHTTCIYDSAAVLMSLHKSKRGAWKAMHKHQWDQWEKARSPEETNLHMGKFACKDERCPRGWMKSIRSHIAPVELHP